MLHRIILWLLNHSYLSCHNIFERVVNTVVDRYIVSGGGGGGRED